MSLNTYIIVLMCTVVLMFSGYNGSFKHHVRTGEMPYWQSVEVELVFML